MSEAAIAEARGHKLLLFLFTHGESEKAQRTRPVDSRKYIYFFLKKKLKKRNTKRDPMIQSTMALT